MSNLPNKKRTDGRYRHSPDCRCMLCETRHRKAQALLGPDGARGDALADKEPEVNADLPIVHARGRKLRERIGQWMEIRTVEPGLTNIEIAKRMGMTRAGLQSCLHRATAQGWLKFDDPLSRMEYELIPKVVDNLNYYLDQKDKAVTIETAKGTIFKAYQDSKGISDAPQTVLALKIETIGVDNAKVVEGHIVGRPREISEQSDEA